MEFSEVVRRRRMVRRYDARPVPPGVVRAALEALMRDRTVLVIAHRLSTIRNADTILVMQGGRVVEAGNHAALLARRGAYARLVSWQMDAVAG